MTKLSNLPRDLVEEVLSRVPLTCIRRVRLTCKEWNTISEDMSFAKKYLSGQAKVAAEAKEFMVVAMMDFRVYLMSVNLYNNNVESCIKCEGQVISRGDSDQVDISKVSYCGGLLLCITKDNTKLVVWNPYWGQTRWIEPTHHLELSNCYTYALGYDESCKSHKLFRFIDFLGFVEFEIYDFNFDSWRILHLILDWSIIQLYKRGVSLKGNTYWLAHNFVACFDFTRERFGPRLPLPFESSWKSILSLSSVREEQIVVLLQKGGTLQMEVWITTKIEPYAVSWNGKVFLKVNMELHFPFQLSNSPSFFIAEEKKVVVVFYKGKENFMNHKRRSVAYIIGADIPSLRQL